MRFSILIAAVGGTAALAACALPPATTVIVPPPAQTACIADQFQQFVGQKSPAITVPAGTEIRHYRTGDPVTMDFSPARVNFEYNRIRELVSVTCG